MPKVRHDLIDGSCSAPMSIYLIAHGSKTGNPLVPLHDPKFLPKK